MAFIFMDESGDIGFDFSKDGTSKYFLITFLLSLRKNPIEKCVKKVHAGLRKKYRKISSVLHANKEREETRRRLLECLSNKDISIMTILMNKQKVYSVLKDEKAVLYNYVTNILLDRIISKKIISAQQPITVIASRRETNKFLNENFKAYLTSQIKLSHKLDINIQICAPTQEKGLQAVDFASWAIFRKYEYNDGGYYRIIEESIIEENPLFP